MSNEMTNLLEETMQFLAALVTANTAGGRARLDPIWVGSADGAVRMTWEQFQDVSRDVWYYAGYGGNEVALNLVVVGPDWWLERREHDGSESWQFKAIPTGFPAERTYTSNEVHLMLLSPYRMADGLEESEDEGDEHEDCAAHM
jgi:hypothetical protein